MKQRFWKVCLFLLLAVGAALSQSKKLLSEADLIDLLKSYVPPARVADLAREKGIDFRVTDQVVTELKNAGADGALIESLRHLAPKQEQAPQPEVKAPKINPKDGQKYVWIPPGTFQMGCSPDDNECNNNEKPALPVRISKGFWMTQTVATVDAWKRYRAATGAGALPESDGKGQNNYNEANGNGSIPIVMLTWNEAKAFCEWTGGRLPTEAEWEYAARAGNPNARYGNLEDIAWYADNSGNFLHPVGQKRPNAWGLYDMLGNVAQWIGGRERSRTAGGDRSAGAASGNNARATRWFVVRPYKVRAGLQSWLDDFGLSPQPHWGPVR